MHHRHPTLFVALLAAFASVAFAVVGSTSPAQATVTVALPPTPTGLPSSIEPLAEDVTDTACDLRTRPGTAELAALLKATYPSTSYATVYACGTDSAHSEHYDGRAIDWMVSARTATGLATADAFLNWLLATDKAGHTDAMMRRLGIQYVIFNNRIWGTWNHAWGPYQNCAVTTSTSYDSYCHRNHVHISLGWNGAMGLTSYWTKTVATTIDYGPCRPSDLNWAYYYYAANPTPCPNYPAATAPSTASALKKTLVAYSGARLTLNMTGPMVTAVQHAIGFTGALGTLNAATIALLRTFQTLHGVKASGIVDPATWRVLLNIVK
jgi:hypothetical protein